MKVSKIIQAQNTEDLKLFREQEQRKGWEVVSPEAVSPVFGLYQELRHLNYQNDNSTQIENS